MSSLNFEELLVAECDGMRQQLCGLERRLIEEYRRALGSMVASSLVGANSDATQVQAWACQLANQEQPGDVDSTSIGVPKVEDHVVCTSFNCLDYDAHGLEVTRVVQARGDSTQVSACHAPLGHSKTPGPGVQTMAWPPAHEPPMMRGRGSLGRTSHGTPAIRSPARSPRGSRCGTPALKSTRASYRSETESPAKHDIGTARLQGRAVQYHSSPDGSPPRGSLGDLVQRAESLKRRSELNPADLNLPTGTRSTRSSFSGTVTGRMAAMQRARASWGDNEEPPEKESCETALLAQQAAAQESKFQQQISDSIEDYEEPPMFGHQTSGSENASEGLTRESSSPGICPASRETSPTASAEPGGFPLGDRFHLASRRSSESAGSAQTAITNITNIKQDKHDFRLLEAWTDASNRQTLFGMSTHAASRTVHGGSYQRRPSQRRSVCQIDVGAIWEGFEERPSWYRFLSALTLPPSSYQHLCWDLLAGILIIFDIFVVPLQLLDPPSVLVLTIMCSIVRLFWTADFIGSFLTGYIDHQGETVMSPGAVARRYAATWMLPDFTLVICDWAEVIAKGTVAYGGTGYARVAGVFSGLRLLRVVRLVRLTKAREVTEFIIEHVQSENMILIADILKIVAVMLALTHAIACAWYGLGKHGESWQRSWVKYRYLEEENLLERYIWSFHCAMAFWTGEHIVHPRNTLERAFLAAMMIVTFMLSVWFVSCMTTAMTRLQIIAGQNSVQFSALSRYLSSKKISQELRAKVLRNAQFAVEQRKRNADESCIDLLPLVSEPLRTELHFEVYSPTLYIHPFFRSFSSVNTTGIRKVCHATLSRLDFSRGDIVFTEEVPAAPKMFFVVKGILLYLQERTRQRKVNHRNWLAEMVLWTTWSHRGTLHAASDCQLLALDAKSFISVISKFPGNQVVAYANSFVAHLRQMEAFELTDIGSEDEEITKLANRAFEQEEVGRESVASMAAQKGLNWLKRSPSERPRGVKFSFHKVLPNKKGIRKSEAVSDADFNGRDRQTTVKFSVGEPDMGSDDGLDDF